MDYLFKRIKLSISVKKTKNENHFFNQCNTSNLFSYGTKEYAYRLKAIGISRFNPIWKVEHTEIMALENRRAEIVII